LPFEPPYFTREGLACDFVGHSIIESGADQGDAARFRAKFGLPPDKILLAVLPGSRATEVKRLLPVYTATIALLKQRYPDLTLIMPVVPSLADKLRQACAGWPLPTIFIDNDQDKYDGFAASRAALACSGTVAIELAMASLPAVITYKVNALTLFLYRRLLKVRFANLVNIMHNKMVVPELLQDDCTPEKMAAALHNLLRDEAARRQQIAGLGAVKAWLGQGQFVPSHRAAQIVLDHIHYAQSAPKS